MFLAFALVSGKAKGLVQIIRKGNKRFDMVRIDHVDICNSRVLGKKHILMVVDAFI